MTYEPRHQECRPLSRLLPELGPPCDKALDDVNKITKYAENINNHVETVIEDFNQTKNDLNLAKNIIIAIVIIIIIILVILLFYNIFYYIFSFKILIFLYI